MGLSPQPLQLVGQPLQLPEPLLDALRLTVEQVPGVPEVGVVAGTVATDNSLRIRISAVGEETALAGIQRLVAQAQESRSRAQVLADRAAALLFYVAIAAALVTFIAWLIVDQPDQAVVSTVAVLVIAEDVEAIVAFVREQQRIQGFEPYPP